MKKLFVFALLCSSAIGFAQNVPNGGFETWTQAGPFLAPSDWATSPNVSQSSLAHSGTYAALLTVDTITNPQTSTLDTIGGLMYTGVQTQGPPPPPGTSYGGFPFTARPDSLGGWLQFTSQQGDAFTISVQLSKWNAAGAAREIIAAANLTNNMDIPNYMYGNMALTYLSSETPDTAFIQFSVGDQAQRHIGTSLWVDDLAFVSNSSSSIASLKASNTLSMFPNPANASFVLKTKSDGLQYTLLDMQGRIVRTGITHNLETFINTADLNNGLYFVRMENGIAQKIQVQH